MSITPTKKPVETQRTSTALEAFRFLGEGRTLRVSNRSAPRFPLPTGLTFHLANALFQTACRFDELYSAHVVRLPEGGGGIVALRIKGKGSVFQDVPVPGRQLRLRSACRALGVGQITAHGLRHSAATILLNHVGKDLREILELLRHKNIRTTVRYTHVDYEQTRQTAES